MLRLGILPGPVSVVELTLTAYSMSGLPTAQQFNLVTVFLYKLVLSASS